VVDATCQGVQSEDVRDNTTGPKLLVVHPLGKRYLNQDLGLTVVRVREGGVTPEPLGVDTRSRAK